MVARRHKEGVTVTALDTRTGRVASEHECPRVNLPQDVERLRAAFGRTGARVEVVDKGD